MFSFGRCCTACHDQMHMSWCGVHVPQAVAGMNQKLQELVVQAQQLAASGDSGASALLQLHVSISKLAAV